jgi:hypothetical protein
MVLIKTQTYQLFYLCIKSDQKKDVSVQEYIKVVRRAIEAFNTDDTSKIHEFISADYINRESHCSCIRDPSSVQFHFINHYLSSVRIHCCYHVCLTYSQSY